MAEIVYFLCALMSVACGFKLFRGYRSTRSQLLLWSSLCFVFLALNNILLVVDLVVLPELDFRGGLWRSGLNAMAGCLLLFGLVWELT